VFCVQEKNQIKAVGLVSNQARPESIAANTEENALYIATKDSVHIARFSTGIC
jgi:hypothetical protein